MKSYREYLWLDTDAKVQFINITDTVQEIVEKSGIKDGLCLVNAMHITSSVIIDDDEKGLQQDYKKWLEKLAPHEPIPQYNHNFFEPNANADAHMKRQIMGREVVVAITDGKLDFGRWEKIFYCEFDGKKKRRALVKIIGG